MLFQLNNSTKPSKLTTYNLQRNKQFIFYTFAQIFRMYILGINYRLIYVDIKTEN